MQAFFTAGAKLSIRALGSTESVPLIILSMSSVSALGSALLCAALPHHFVVPPSLRAWALLGATGACGCGVQLFGTQALRLAQAAPAVAMSFATVLWGVVIDAALFDTPPTPLALLGAAIVCASGFIVVHGERQRAAQAAAAVPAPRPEPALGKQRGSDGEVELGTADPGQPARSGARGEYAGLAMAEKP